MLHLDCKHVRTEPSHTCLLGLSDLQVEKERAVPARLSIEFQRGRPVCHFCSDIACFVDHIGDELTKAKKQCYNTVVTIKVLSLFEHYYYNLHAELHG